ncbi:12892_t:CDS:2 [Acaulospora colombiana]|uniref:12892_t:CDS:1 n=1 Tax=Acaulospora colombiana TaxID=27376 RepID=A0ACA9LLY0_9GLOM|nr:12892_t:CDS:2 [Acaulospora colombiana]
MPSPQQNYPATAPVSSNYQMNNYMYAQPPHQYMVQQTMHQSMAAMSLPMNTVPMQVSSAANPVPMNVPASVAPSAQLTNSNAPSITMSQQASPDIDGSISGDLLSPSLISPSPKKPKLRVHIPEVKEKQPAPGANQQPQPTRQDQSPEQEETPSDTQPVSTQPMLSSRPTPATAEAGPTSALPSQFAQNLPSPSTFFSEFYKTTELPSPLTFGNTPTSANPIAFPWPPRATNAYQPSPLAKQHENNSNYSKGRSAPTDGDESDEPDKKKAKQ